MRKDERLIPPHGGYENLKSYQSALIVYDATVVFCRSFIDRRSRTVDQIDQQLRQLEKQFLEEGGITERMYHARKHYRGKQ